MSEMVFKFKDAAHFRPDFDKQAGAARLAAMLERDGSLSTAALIKDGQDKRSPLYPQFTHDPAEALRRVWTAEADYLRRAFVTVVPDEKGIAREVRAVVPVYATEDAEERIYVSTVEAMSNEDYRKQVLQDAIDDFIVLRRKWADLEELVGIFRSIDRTAKNLRAA